MKKWAVCVKPSARKRISTNGLIWVAAKRHEYYVSMCDRGEWDTKAEAESHITEKWEIAVEVESRR